jgi:stage III sporulation protein AH
MLAIAVYINYSMSQTPTVTPVTELTENRSYGETEFVSAAPTPEAEAEAQITPVIAEPDPAADYFAQARLNKTVSRDEAVQTLQSIMGGGDITGDEAVANALNAVELSSLIESEGRIESLIRSQGFADCVVYLDGDSAKVVVRTNGLEAKDAALIKDLILSEVSVTPENIRIFEAT